MAIDQELRPSDAARRLWLSLEPLHDVVYFAPGVRDAGVDLGLRGYWMTYFAFRAAPLGPVGPASVVAMFAGFQPDMVAKALPDAWSRTAPHACLDKRTEVSAAALRAAGVDPAACWSAVEMLAPVAVSADATGRPLYAANAAVPLSDDPVGALWQLTTCLREHRGDGHVAALVAAGVTGLEGHLLQVGAGRFGSEAIRGVRGWTEAEWTTAGERLRAAGLLSDEPVPTLTATGRTVLGEIETRTDEAAWTGGLAAMGESAIDEVVALLRPAVQAIWSTGMLPSASPTGLPAPT